MASTGLKKIILTKLWTELTERNRYTAIVQLLLCLVSFVICYGMHAHSLWTLIGYLMIGLGCLSRIYLLLQMPVKDLPKRSLEIAYYLSVFCIGSGWAKIFIDIIDYYGFFSPHSFYCLMLMAGQFSGAVATFSANPKAYATYILPMSIFPSIFLYSKLNDPSVTLTLIAFFTLFYLYQIRLSHLYIKRSIENELAQTLERDKLSSLLNAVPGFVSFIDNELRYQILNEFGKSYYNEQNILGKSVGFLHPESEFVKFVQDFMTSERETSTRELSIEFSGEMKSFVVSIKKIFEPIGGAVIVSVPMDELVSARENLRVQEAKSHYTAKLVSIGEMAAGIAHEINNPLAIIQGSSDQIEKITAKSDVDLAKLIEYNLKIQKTVGRISKIIKSLKGLARNGENDPFVPMSFPLILEPCIEITRQRFRDEKVSLEILPYNQDLTFSGQEIQLSQVLMNLINNAFDAAIENEHPRWVKIEIIESEEFADVRISDSGKGIPESIKHKIMEPFFTTKPINKGTGLGLSISKNILENHHGALLLDESAPHTTFIMRLKK